jgi:hypothetical protein
MLIHVISRKPKADTIFVGLPYVIAMRLKAEEAISGGWRSVAGVAVTPHPSLTEIAALTTFARNDSWVDDGG